jgi:hypothetical protein
MAHIYDRRVGTALTLDDAAAMLRVHPATLRAALVRDGIPHRRTADDQPEFRREELLAWLEAGSNRGSRQAA